ncbi:MAG: T9SS type A sorting domain-containing protein [Bacteroidetes bacterium]|nr:T9SS type A sorting domain-containing protein [Bacteroidota bacterium]
MKTKTAILLLFILGSTAHTQQKVTEGSLLKINFYQSVIDTNNKVEHWQSITTPNGYTVETFENVFTGKNQQYFIKKISNSGSYVSSAYPPSFQTKLINTTKKNESLLFGTYYPECGTGVYLSDATAILHTNNEFILTNNLNSIGYLLSSDSLYSLNDEVNRFKAIQIVGKINDDYLLTATGSDYGCIYCLINFDIRHNLVVKKKVSFPGMQSPFSTAPVKCYGLDNSLFIISFDWSNKLYIDRLIDTSFVKVDSVTFNSQRFWWTIKNNNMYFLDSQNLVRRLFNKNNMSFDPKETILATVTNTGTDVDNNFFAAICNDSLYIYSLGQNKLINKFHYSTSNRFYNILVDSPYVYIPVVDKITGVNLPKNVPKEFYLSQNYPNPFNPTTTIKFSIPNSQFATLKVYDMLGREVATLVNEEKAPGNYEVKFDGSNLSSGVYFYRMQAGSFSQTKKFVIQK